MIINLILFLLVFLVTYNPILSQSKNTSELSNKKEQLEKEIEDLSQKKEKLQEEIRELDEKKRRYIQ